VHFLVSRASTLSEVELATIISDSSEKFINKKRLVAGIFSWQQSAVAFSVSKSAIDRVCKYILNQPEHHKNESFAQEYEHLLKIYQANYKIDNPDSHRDGVHCLVTKFEFIKVRFLKTHH